MKLGWRWWAYHIWSKATWYLNPVVWSWRLRHKVKQWKTNRIIKKADRLIAKYSKEV